MLLTKKKDYKLYVEVKKEEKEEEKKLTEITFSNLELLHEIVMSSLPQQRLPRETGARFRSELAYRIFLLETALDVRGDVLVKSRRISHLDSSEKSLIHYYFGMAFTKMIARRMFQVDCLLPVSVIPAKEGGYLKAPGSNRNDLIGGAFFGEEYSVWSVKGRSQNSLTAIRIGCREVSDFVRVCDSPVSLKAVCMTYYDNGYLNAVVQIPGQSSLEKSRQVSVDFSREDYLRAYYHCVAGLFGTKGEKKMYRRDRKFFEDGICLGIPLYPTEETGASRTLHVGMSEELLRNVRQDSASFTSCLQSLCWQETLDHGKYMGGDFIYLY